MKTSRKYRSSCIFASMMMLIAVSSFAGRAGQNGDRTLRRFRRDSGEPVRLSNIRVRGKRVRLGQPFSETSDWPQTISLDVTNISQKNITNLTVVAYAPGPGAYRMTVGTFGSPTWVYGVEATDVLKPQEKVHFEFDQANYSVRFPTLPEQAKTELADPSQITMRLGAVVFDDGTMWKGGHLLRRDPDNNDRWLVTGVAQPATHGTNFKRVSYAQGCDCGTFQTQNTVSCGQGCQAMSDYLVYDPPCGQQITQTATVDCTPSSKKNPLPCTGTTEVDEQEAGTNCSVSGDDDDDDDDCDPGDIGCLDYLKKVPRRPGGLGLIQPY